MAEKNRFQRELEKNALKQIITIILIGCLFFCVAVVGFLVAEKRMQREGHLDAVTEAFGEISRSVEAFLEDGGNAELFFGCAAGEPVRNRVQYQVTDFNLYAPVGINLILTDADGDVAYSSFSGEELNLHRREFNRVSGKNAREQGDGLYRTVYYIAGDTSEYVVIRPLFLDGAYAGCAAAYLKPEDWGRHFLKYQYDTILTDCNGNVIYCSNYSFLSGYAINKYVPADSDAYQWFNDSRYLTSSRYLGKEGVNIYSFIYYPGYYSYMVIGVLVILGLGIVWTLMFFHLMHQMAAKTSESVHMLVEEIRIIRKQDPGHVIHIETEDEIEEIAGQINKMVASINDLNRKNLELAQVNDRMEMQNLQAQVNPHFIYNTLDNIRYLIVQDAAKADELIERFTHILRYSINNTKHRIFLQEDMDYIVDYLTIQKTRFGERFRYDIEIQKECYRMPVPKLLLQPLIENSLKYGFRKKTSIYVKISGWIEGGYMVLRVEDDGPGQPKVTLETLRGILSREEVNTTHNGLQNISRRIVLEYGHGSGMDVESREGEGFTVTLKMWIGGDE